MKLIDTDTNTDLIISYNYKHIISEDIIKLFPHKIINLHIGYLPFNRGADPNAWSFIDETQPGVTIHEIDKGIDTGDILIRKKVHIDTYFHTFRSSYDKLNSILQELFVLH